MKKMSEVAPRLLVVQIQIQAVWTSTQKVLFTDKNSAQEVQRLKKTLQDLKIC